MNVAAAQRFQIMAAQVMQQQMKASNTATGAGLNLSPNVNAVKSGNLASDGNGESGVPFITSPTPVPNELLPIPATLK